LIWGVLGPKERVDFRDFRMRVFGSGTSMHDDQHT
jgi:hypothetical protein